MKLPSNQTQKHVMHIIIPQVREQKVRCAWYKIMHRQCHIFLSPASVNAMKSQARKLLTDVQYNYKISFYFPFIYNTLFVPNNFCKFSFYPNAM